MHKTTAKETPQLFQLYELTSAELEAGQLFNDAQRAVLHNLRAEYAEQKLALLFTPENIVNYAQQEAELRAKVDLLTDLLAVPEVSDEPQQP